MTMAMMTMLMMAEAVDVDSAAVTVDHLVAIAVGSDHEERWNGRRDKQRNLVHRVERHTTWIQENKEQHNAKAKQR